ncbi:MAG TPA: zinc ribbon domain-containing protein [Thermoanaerobaculia bacterium]|nr:zinc ribbon domain-containing protein [Thermoanaerobaculia bacterium]
MPVYEYRCRACGHRFEILQRMGEGGEGLECPRCSEPAPEKQLSSFAARSTSGISASSGTAPGCGAPACGTGFS